MQETRVRFIGQEDRLEKGMATHSSVLVWRIRWAEEPGGLQTMRLQRVRHSFASKQHIFIFPLCVCLSLNEVSISLFHVIPTLPPQHSFVNLSACH